MRFVPSAVQSSSSVLITSDLSCEALLCNSLQVLQISLSPSSRPEPPPVCGALGVRDATWAAAQMGVDGEGSSAEFSAYRQATVQQVATENEMLRYIAGRLPWGTAIAQASPDLEVSCRTPLDYIICDNAPLLPSTATGTLDETAQDMSCDASHDAYIAPLQLPHDSDDEPLLPPILPTNGHSWDQKKSLASVLNVSQDALCENPDCQGTNDTQHIGSPPHTQMPESASSPTRPCVRYMPSPERVPSPTRGAWCGMDDDWEQIERRENTQVQRNSFSRKQSDKGAWRWSKVPAPSVEATYQPLGKNKYDSNTTNANIVQGSRNDSKNTRIPVFSSVSAFKRPRVRLVRNGFQNDTPSRPIVVHSLRTLLDEAASILDLNRAPRKLFTTSGEEIFTLQQLIGSEIVVISTGEEFKGIK